MIPYWIVQKRTQICASCKQGRDCVEKQKVTEEIMACPRKVISSAAVEIQMKAWPPRRGPISGCCDSPLNYPPPE